MAPADEAVPTKTMPALAREALCVQDAVNLSGVALALFEACQSLRRLRGYAIGTDDVNRHPLILLYVAKLLALARPGDELSLSEEFGAAYAWARREAAADSGDQPR